MNTTQAKFQKNSKTANWTWTFIYLEQTQAKIPDKLKNFQLDLAKKCQKKPCLLSPLKSPTVFGLFFSNKTVSVSFFRLSTFVADVSPKLVVQATKLPIHTTITPYLLLPSVQPQPELRSAGHCRTSKPWAFFTTVRPELGLGRPPAEETFTLSEGLPKTMSGGGQRQASSQPVLRPTPVSDQQVGQIFLYFKNSTTYHWLDSFKLLWLPLTYHTSKVSFYLVILRLYMR